MSTPSRSTIQQIEDTIILMGKTALGPMPEDPYVAEG